MELIAKEARDRIHTKLWQILKPQDGSEPMYSLANSRETFAEFIAVCFSPEHLSLIGEESNLLDLKTVLYVLRHHGGYLFDRLKFNSQDTVCSLNPMDIQFDPDGSLNDEMVMGFVESDRSHAFDSRSLPAFNLTELHKVGHNELFATKYFLEILASASSNSQATLSLTSGTIVTICDTLVQTVLHCHVSNYVSHLLASLIYTSAIITKEFGLTFGYMHDGDYLSTYDVVAMALGLVPDNVSIYKVMIHPELASYEEAVSYFLKLAVVLCRVIRAHHFILPSVPNLMLEALFDVFFQTLETDCIEMCCDLYQLGSLRRLPGSMHLDFFIRTLTLINNFLPVVSIGQDEAPEEKAILLNLETCLARVLCDIMDVMPTCAYCLVRSHEAFTNTITLLGEIKPMTSRLPESLMHCIFKFSRYSNHPTIADLEKVLEGLQHSTPASHVILLAHSANISSLLSTRLSYAVFYADPLCQFSELTCKDSRKASGGVLNPRIKKEFKEEDPGEAYITFDRNVKLIIKLRRLGNSDRDVSFGLFAHFSHHILTYFGRLRTENRSDLKDILAVFELGTRILPVECFDRLYQMLCCLLETLYIFMENDLLHISETFYQDLGSLAELFTRSASQLGFWGSDSCRCYRTMFQIFAAVWKSKIRTMTLSDLEDVFNRNQLNELLKAATEDLNLLFGLNHSDHNYPFNELASFSLSGMVALLLHSEIKHDSYFAILLAALFYSIQNSTLVAIQEHAWELLPNLLSCKPFVNYLELDNQKRLLDMFYSGKIHSEASKAAFATNFGDLICNMSRICTQPEKTPLFPLDEPCQRCNGAVFFCRQGEFDGISYNEFKPNFSLPLESFPTKALKSLLIYTKPEVPFQLRLASCLSLFKALAHLPLKHYGELNNIIPDLCSLVFDQQSDIQLIGRALILNLASFEESKVKNVFLSQATSYLLELAKQDFSLDMLETLLSLLTDLAKKSSPQSLASIIYFMAGYLYHDDKRMVASIFTKLNAIASAHKIHVKALFFPLWPDFTDFIVNDLKSGGHFISNLAIVLQVNVSGILKLSSPHMLPRLVIDKDTETLKKLAKIIHDDPSPDTKDSTEIERVVRVCVDKLHHIMASLLLLPEGDQKDALEFFYKLTANLPRFRSDKIVESCSEDLILLLVLELGGADNNSFYANEPEKALGAVAKQLASPKDSKRDIDGIRGLLMNRLMFLFSSFNSFLSEYRHPQLYQMQIKTLRALDILIILVEDHVKIFIPQILSAVKIATSFSFFAASGIKICTSLFERLDYELLQPFVNQILAIFSEGYTTLDSTDQKATVVLLNNIYEQSFKKENYRVISLPESIHDFKLLNELHARKLSTLNPIKAVGLLIQTIHLENIEVCIRALKDLHLLLIKKKATVTSWVLEEPIQPIVNKMVLVLANVCERFHENSRPELQYNVMLCLGTLGAVDPDRLSPKKIESRSKVTFVPYGKDPCILIASELIEKHLVKIYSNTVVATDQFYVAYAIQELMKFCDFNSSNLTVEHAQGAEPFSRKVWDKLPIMVVEVIHPLMSSCYQVSSRPSAETKHPIFCDEIPFETWICRWTTTLILNVEGDTTKGLFLPCIHAAEKYVEVATFLLPHLLLAVVLQNNSSLSTKISQEIHAVLKISAGQTSTVLHSKASQLIFSVLSHLSNWCYRIRYLLLRDNIPLFEKNDLKAALVICQPFLQSIPHLLLAQAAHKTRNHGHAVFYLEAHIREMQINPGNITKRDKDDVYTQLHDLYFQLDDIDGLQGVQNMFLVSNAQQQLREHEASKNWLAAQTCYEVLANTGLNPEACQQGIVSCMKNMGSLDLAINHLAGLTAQLPTISLHDNFQQTLDEASWRLGKWDQESLEPSETEPSIDHCFSQLLLSAKSSNSRLFSLHLEAGRKMLLKEFSGQIAHSYTRCYDTTVSLHMLNEAEDFHSQWNATPADSRIAILSQAEKSWSTRLFSTRPSFKVRESILDFQRALVDAHYRAEPKTSLKSKVDELLASNYIQCAKFARKAGYFQTSYRTHLEHLQTDKPAAVMEMAKWHWSQGQTWTAVGILMKLLGNTAPNLMATHFDTDSVVFAESLEQSQVRLKLVKWMMSIHACHQEVIAQEFRKLRQAQPEWEKCHFYNAQFLFGLPAHKASSAPQSEIIEIVVRQLDETVTCGLNCLRISPKYVYELLPRILTQWLYCNIAFTKKSKLLDNTNKVMLNMAVSLPVYLFLPVLSQIVSRMNTVIPEVFNVLDTIIFRIMQSYPQQALWALVGTSASIEGLRRERYATLLNKVSSGSKKVATLAKDMQSFCKDLLKIASVSLNSYDEQPLKRFLPSYKENSPLSVIMPTQAALGFNLPSAISRHHSADFSPFPSDAVTIVKILPRVKVMVSAVKPRLLTFQGSDGNTYQFLCKPKDDLRKDSRLIELFHFLNRMFRQDPEARRRQLYIRTFAVVPLDHQCGLVEWVNNVVTMRKCILDAYRAREHACLNNDTLKRLIGTKPPATRQLHEDRIRVFNREILPAFPPIFHEWFLKCFPHPIKWLAARSAYTHTAAVMSIVGFVVGLGDRHGENILMDTTTGDVMHVDFSCLFERGLDLVVPELVPFRLTHNMIDALGTSGYRGAFQKSCEVTMSILRSNKETLKAQLETFLHDPLSDFLSKDRLLITDVPLMASRKHFVECIKANPPYPSLEKSSSLNNPYILWALERISNKLDGKSSSVYPAPPGTFVQPLSVEGQVLQLLQSSSDIGNLSCMYIGWGSYL